MLVLLTRVSHADQNRYDGTRKGLGVYSTNQEFQVYATNWRDNLDRTEADRTQRPGRRNVRELRGQQTANYTSTSNRDRTSQCAYTMRLMTWLQKCLVRKGGGETDLLRSTIR
jgi:hypothetical protein